MTLWSICSSDCLCIARIILPSPWSSTISKRNKRVRLLVYGPGPLAQADGGHVKEMVNYIYVYTIIFRSHLGYCKPAAALRRPLRRPYCGPTTAVQPGAGPGPGFGVVA